MIVQLAEYSYHQFDEADLAATMAAVDWSLRDIEGDAIDAFADLPRPSAEEQAAWLRLFIWHQVYAYTRCRLQAPPAEARRAFTDPDVQREIRRDARRMLREILE